MALIGRIPYFVYTIYTMDIATASVVTRGLMVHGKT